jgi:hypothetical protein
MDHVTPQDLWAQVQELRAYIEAQAQAPNPAMPQARETYKIFEQYDHSTPKSWPQFELKLRSKLAIDGHLLGSHEARIRRLFAYLTGTAAERALPWVESYAATSTIDEFLGHLGTLFGDPTRREKALTRLNVLRQGRKRFTEFLPEFDQVLTEAGASEWDDRAKIGYLRSALSLELRDRAVGLIQTSRYTDYCRRLQELATELEEVQFIRNRVVRGGPRASHAPGTTSTEMMDWEPTPTSTVRLNAARTQVTGLTQAQTRDRLARGVCLRCESPDHIARSCPQARRGAPKNRDPKAARVHHTSPAYAENAPEAEAYENEEHDSGKE